VLINGPPFELALLDTSGLNRLADDPFALAHMEQARATGTVEVALTAEAAAEIRNTRDPARLAKLEIILAALFPEADKRTSMTDHATLHCPKCGRDLRHVATAGPEHPFEVFECPVHGPFHYGPKTELLEGLPSPPNG
jgi:hypothetical protein